MNSTRNLFWKNEHWHGVPGNASESAANAGLSMAI
jgi:hypothetical protein